MKRERSGVTVRDYVKVEEEVETPPHPLLPSQPQPFQTDLYWTVLCTTQRQVRSGMEELRVMERHRCRMLEQLTSLSEVLVEVHSNPSGSVATMLNNSSNSGGITVEMMEERVLHLERSVMDVCRNRQALIEMVREDVDSCVCGKK